jgi:hypothetical protein
MKGDFTRTTYRADKHYRSVRMQQGRVQLDADWNEQVDIEAHRADAHAADVVGPAGGRYSNGGFAIAASAADLPPEQASGALPLTAANDFYLSAGRYYVGGLACENETPVPYSLQPDLPSPALPAPGRHLVYLDAFEQHVSAIEDPEIREVALGGPDTATRTKLVWQVRLLALPNPDDGAPEARAALASLVATDRGALHARAQPTVASDEPCSIAPGAGYRRLENQLYRVEIHEPARSTPGSLGHATFKWSRDNASVVTAWLWQDGAELGVESRGRDNTTAFRPGDWVELTDDTRELLGEPGVLAELTAVSSETLTIAASVDRADFPRNPKVRRWNTVSATGARVVEVPAVNDGYLDIEDGVQVKFVEGTYASGDYWLIPARSALGSVEWSTDFVPAHGPTHRYAALAVVDYDGSTLAVVADLRARFPSATELAGLFPIGGNAQQATLGQTLPLPLEVGVASGKWPVAGAAVRFEVSSGAGLLDAATGPVDAITDADGRASCRWTLGTVLAPQLVTARLLDETGAAVHLPVHFHATIGTSAVDAAARVTAVTLTDGTVIENDQDIPADRFATGLHILTDRRIADESVSRATVSVTVELPWPLSSQSPWTADQLGHQPVIVRGESRARPTFITWEPRGPARSWLEADLFAVLEDAGHTDPILVWLRVHGDFLWARTDPSVLLDGEAFGSPAATGTQPRIGLALPSGDGRRGGTFETWFWLVHVSIVMTVDALQVLPGDTVGVSVVVTGANNKDVTVSASVGSIVPGATAGEFIYTAPRERPGPTLPRLIEPDPLGDHAIITAASVVDPTKIATERIRLLDRSF